MGKRPLVLNMKHYYSGLPENAVYIGRPSKWGNPFIGKYKHEVLEKYEEWIYNQPDLLQAAKIELRGKHLVCWCAPDFCHGDILLRIANEFDSL